MKDARNPIAQAQASQLMYAIQIVNRIRANYWEFFQAYFSGAWDTRTLQNLDCPQ
jgi:hypothetical protein